MSTHSRSRLHLGAFVAAAALALAAVAGAAPAQAATSSTDLVLVEGVGIGSAITLGQTRSSVISTLKTYGANNGNCDAGTDCTFRLSPDTAAVTVSFTTTNQVQRIHVVQGGVALDKRWQTSAGVVDGASPATVAALYPGSVINQDTLGQHVVTKSGYTYNWRSTCYSGCQITTSHDIYVANGATLPGTGEVTAPEFSGSIAVYNTLRKSTTLTLKLTITDPSGRVSAVTQSVYAAGRSTLVLDPNDLLSTAGPLGTYSYKAVLRSGTKTVGSATGSIVLR